jgi:hypothetical protein
MTVVTVVVLVTVTGALVAQAQPGRAASTVTIHWNSGAHKFAGKVSSTDTGCVQGRTVRVYKVRAGADHLVATETTSATGRYSISRATARGKFYAKVTRGVSGTYGSTEVCESDRSPTIEVS